jgi:hypothetical protein
MNAAVVMETCPNEETLAAFIDGRLDEKSRLDVLEHVANCGDCRDIVVTGADLAVMDGQLPEKVAASRFASRVLMPFAAAAAIAALIFGVTPIRERLLGKSGMPALVEAADSLPERTTEARLSGDFAHRDFSPKRGNDDKPDPEYRVYAAAARIAERAEKNPNAKNLHELGVAHILLKEGQPAIEALERAVSKGPVTAELLTDLSAAYLMHHDAKRAHAMASQAWQLKQTPTTAWNLAVTLQALDDPRAVAAWRKYLELDPTSAWATEATRHLSYLQEQ